MIVHSKPKLFFSSYISVICNLLRKNLDTKNEEEVLKKRLSKFYNKDQVHLTCNGKHALVIAFLNNLNKFNNEVILSPYNCEDIFSVLNYLKLKPVFCDTDDFGQIIPDTLDKYINDKTGYIYISNNFGQRLSLNNKFFHGIHIIEDCTHSIKYENINSEIVISFGATKPLSGGSGGAYISSKNLNKIAEDFYKLDARLNDFNISILLNQLNNLNKITKKRMKIHNKYTKFFEEYGINFLENKNNDIPYRFVIKSSKGEILNIKKYLNAKKIRVEYPITPPSIIKEKISKTILSFPLYPDLSNTELIKILNETRKVLKKNGY